ncbi:MAG: hypothetical protein M1831_001284 [Alyxoria varia]|nr:MAG: hypothetical protein M1831_001284 [Alyxoria varia]
MAQTTPSPTPSRPVLGPLTTTFTPPPSCSFLYAVGETEFNRASTCGDFYGDDLSCWPPPTARVREKVADLAGYGIYSPGLYCPKGHATACRATAGNYGGFSFQFPLGGGETAVGCCPTGYECDPQIATGPSQYCFQTLSRGETTQIVAAPSCSGDIITHDFPKTVSASGDDDSSTVYSDATLFAPLFQLVWKGSDRREGDLNNSAASAADAEGGDDDGSSNVGAIAGGVVGGVAGLAILLVVFFWLLRRAKKRRQVGKSNQEEAAEYHAPAGTGKEREYLAEVDGDNVKCELDGQSAGKGLIELEGDSRR